MKKMQCEVCGSNEIKKVADGVFECQSCGVQYSKEDVQKLLVEITGSVKIDHSDEVKNAITRAEQFNDEGNIDKAEEYYNKALDMDAENSQAKEEIKKIKKEKSLPQNLFFLKKDIDGNDSITTFLKGLKEENNIAPDIYKEIEIISITEKYFPFLIISGTYSGSYYGTACYGRLVEYTDWEDYTDFVDGKFVTRRRQIKRPPTIVYDEKKPSNGTYSTEYRGIYSISSNFNKLLTEYEPNVFDIMRSSEDGDIEFLNSSLIKSIEDKLNSCRDGLYENIIKIRPDNMPSDIPVDFISNDKAWLKRAKSLYKKGVNSECGLCAESCIGGDKAENVSFDYKIDREDISNLYLPIQVIKYAYKGDICCAINILSSKCNTSIFVYPYFKQLENIVYKCNQENSNRAQSVENIRPKGGYGAWAWTVAVFALLIGWAFGKNTYLFRDILYIFSYINFGLGAFLTILGVINRFKLNKIKKENLISQEINKNKVKSVQNHNKKELEKEYKIFFDNYTGIESISKCNDILEKSCDFSCQISEITYRTNREKAAIL